jgi:hypothetical protein
MIDFGLFSSQLPYIIFIAVYMLYFGASSLFRHDTGKNAIQSEFTERQVTDNKGHDSKTLVCKITSTDNFAAQKDTDPIENIAGNFPSIICYPRDNILHLQLFTGSAVFSRPPPFTS